MVGYVFRHGRTLGTFRDPMTMFTTSKLLICHMHKLEPQVGFEPTFATPLQITA